MPPAQWTTTRFSNGCATTGFDCFEGSRQAARLFFNYSVVISAPSQGLTQTVTQMRKRPGSIGRTQWMPHRAESTQKGRKALRHNAFRRSSYLHTQEVTGSSPAVSTKKFLISQEIRNFFCLWGEIVTRYFSVFPSTQTVTQDTKGPESTGQERRGYTHRSCPLFCLLHCLTDDIADGICGIPFHLLRGVGVGAEGKACVVVPQRTR